MSIRLGDTPFSCAQIVAIAAQDQPVELSPASRTRILAARALIERQEAKATPIYGVNTGLGGNLRHRIPAEEIEAFQRQIIIGRMIGVGPALDPLLCRTALLCRLIEFASGSSGTSLATIELLCDMFNRGLTPVLPGRGTIGASDIGLLAHMAAVAIGEGEAWYRGERMAGAAALAAAGLAPALLKAKDGIGIINHAAVSGALAASTIVEADDVLFASSVVGALSFEGYAANINILDSRLHEARPAAGQVAAAARLREMLVGSALYQPGMARDVQDVLSFRLFAPALGSALAAHEHARGETEIEVNGITITPMVMADGAILSSPNFHTPALSLAFDSLAIALTHLASLSAYRLSKLMTGHLSGLPKYLSPVGGGSAGYVSLQKTTSALYSEIRSHAGPVGLDALPVSDTVEDVASYSFQAISKLRAQLLPFRYILAIEALAAAQAVDLRAISPLGAITGQLYHAIRDCVPPLTVDRPPGADVESVVKALFLPHVLAKLRYILATAR